MTQEQIVRDKIEQTVRRIWHGVVPVEQAIDAAMRFRCELPGEHQSFFDALIMEGVLPERVVCTCKEREL